MSELHTDTIKKTREEVIEGLKEMLWAGNGSFERFNADERDILSRAIDIIESNHDSFYEFLLNVINPNEIEKYRSMFLSSGEIVNGEQKGENNG